VSCKGGIVHTKLNRYPFLREKKTDGYLEQLVDNLHENAGVGTLLLHLAVQLPVNLATTRIQVNLVNGEEGRPLPDIANDPESNDNRESQARLEETLSIVELATIGTTANRPDGHVHLGDKDEDRKNETNVRAGNTSRRLEGDLVERAALALPGHAETNVGQADGTPGEKGSEARDTEQPVEKLLTGLGLGSGKGEETDSQDEDGRVERTAGTVDVREELGGIALLRHGREGTASAVNARETDGNDRDDDDGVDKVVVAAETSILADQHERRGL